MNISTLGLRSLANKIKNKTISCVDVANECLKVIQEKQNLNAFTYLNQKQVLDDAFRLDKELNEGNIRGRLHGIPLVIKDCIHVKGVPNTVGTLSLKHFYPKEDAIVVDLLRKEGAIFMGKTNMHEMGLGITSNNLAFGPVRHPLNVDYSPGGSSSGNAVALATGMAFGGIGGDTAGSISIPSSVNGICGLRPTVGRYPLDGVTPFSTNRDTIGPMGLYIDDLMLLDEIMKRENDKNDRASFKGLRIGVPSDTLCASLHEDINNAFNNFKLKLLQSNVELIDVDLKELVKLADDCGGAIVFYESYSNLTKYLKEYNTNLSLDDLTDRILSPDVKYVYKNVVRPDGPKSIKESDYKIAINETRPKLIDGYKQLYKRHNLNALIYPTLAVLPVRFDEVKEPQTVHIFIKNVKLGTIAGFPSVTMPMGKSKNGFPIGVSVSAQINSDRYLLNLCLLIEQLLKQ